jgi:hypothetical protein
MSRMFAVFLLSISLAAAAQESAAPSFKAGDSWKFRRHDIGNKQEPFVYSNIVQSSTEEQAVLLGDSRPPATPPGKYWWIYDTKKSHWAARFAYSESSADRRGARLLDATADDPALRFPMAVGKEWKVKDRWTSPTAKGSSESTAKVMAFEKVQTPAGEFEAFKIVSEGWWHNETFDNRGRLLRTLWFAPAAKRIVKSEMKDWHAGRLWNHQIEELVELKLAP